LNFAPPGGGVASGGGVGARKKGGRWTDRAKQKRDMKRQVKTGEPKQQQQSTSSRPSASSVPAPPAPAVASSSSSRPAGNPAPPPRTLNPQASSRAALQTPAHAAPSAPANTTSIGRPKSQPSTNHSNPANQIVSSLFSSNPRPLSHLPPTEDDGAALDDAGPVGEPSNAPLDTSTFDGLGLDPLITRHLKTKMGIERPTSIQRAALSRLLDPTPLTPPLRAGSTRRP